MLSEGRLIEPECRLMAATEGGGTGSASLAVRYSVSFSGTDIFWRSSQVVLATLNMPDAGALLTLKRLIYVSFT